MITTIPILEKTVSVLEVIAESQDGVNAKSLSISLGIPPATCYRILRTLNKHNWVRNNGEGRYQLAFGLAALTRSYTEIERLLRELEAPLRALSDDTGLSVKISLREGDCATTATRTESRHPNIVTSPVGSKTHLALSGAVGAILLASLSREQSDEILANAPKECWAKYPRPSFQEDVREAKTRGISCALGKFHPSIYAMAVPLRMADDNTAAVAVVGWPDDFPVARQKVVKTKLKQHALRMQQIIDSFSRQQ